MTTLISRYDDSHKYDGSDIKLQWVTLLDKMTHTTRYEESQNYIYVELHNSTTMMNRRTRFNDSDG